jgi:CheY-like chemotaxis protein
MEHLRPILLVDDNDVDVELTLMAFEQTRLANPIEVARDGQEALEWVPRWEANEPLPLVVLLDINMPKVDGIEVLRQFKAHPTLHAVPVVMLTSSSFAADVAAAYQAGANSYIVKPVGIQQIVQVASQIQSYWTVLNRGVQ